MAANKADWSTHWLYDIISSNEAAQSWDQDGRLGQVHISCSHGPLMKSSWLGDLHLTIATRKSHPLVPAAQICRCEGTTFAVV